VCLLFLWQDGQRKSKRKKVKVYLKGLVLVQPIQWPASYMVCPYWRTNGRDRLRLFFTFPSTTCINNQITVKNLIPPALGWPKRAQVVDGRMDPARQAGSFVKKEIMGDLFFFICLCWLLITIHPVFCHWITRPRTDSWWCKEKTILHFLVCFVLLYYELNLKYFDFIERSLKLNNITPFIYLLLVVVYINFGY
jgi:hypothetical protein